MKSETFIWTKSMFIRLSKDWKLSEAKQWCRENDVRPMIHPRTETEATSAGLVTKNVYYEFRFKAKNRYDAVMFKLTFGGT